MAERFFNKYFLGAILWGGLILLITLTPGKYVPTNTLFSYDKLGHAVVFAVLAFLLRKGLSIKFATLIVLTVTALYGLMIEIAQEFIPDRGMEWFDAVANVTGSFFGILVFYLSKKSKS